MTKNTKKCPHCGGSHPELSGKGITLTLVEYDVEDLGALFLGIYDTVYCHEQELPILGVQPTVEFLSDAPLAHYLVVGTLAVPFQDTVVEEARANCLTLSADLEPQLLVSMDALREVVRIKLQNNIQEFNQVITAPDEDARMEVWANFCIRHFAAAKIALDFPSALISISSPVHGLTLKGEDVIPLLADYQAMSWVGLWVSRVKTDKKAPNLGAQLNTRFYRNVLLPGAAEKALTYLNIIEREIRHRSFHSEYSLQAIRACICDLAQMDNPQSRHWVDLFFKAELGLRVGDPQAQLDVQCLTLTQKQAQATIHYPQALEVVTEILMHGKNPLGWFDALEDVATKAGHPGLLGAAVAALVKDVFKESTVDQLTRLIRSALEDESAFPDVDSFLRQATQGLVDGGHLDDLELLAQNVIALKPNSKPLRAAVYSWLGSSLKQLDECQRFLEIVGYEVPKWEEKLPSKLRIRLWLERSNALRMIGHAIKALNLIQVVVHSTGSLKDPTDVDEVADYAVARLNHAILQREAGAPDLAMAELETLLTLKVLRVDLRIHILKTLANAYRHMGRLDMMVKCCQQSVELAVKPFDNVKPEAEVNLALALAIYERYDEAITLLNEVDMEIGVQPSILFTATSAWLTIIINTNVSWTGREALRKIVKTLSHLVAQTAKRGSLKYHLTCLRLLGSIAELSDNKDRARTYWERIVKLCDEQQQPASYLELLPLARNAFRDGHIELACDYLLSLPTALAVDAGQAMDTAAVAEGLAPLIRRQLDELVPIVWDTRRYEELRLIAEMRRNVVSRSQRYLNEDLSAIELEVRENGLSDKALSTLAPEIGRIGILEWIDCPEWIACFITIIESTGNVHCHLLEYPEINLDKLASDMHYSLRDWHKERPGDPFNSPVWCKFEEWLTSELSEYLEDDDHLVVIEHKRFTGLPWHVAAAPRWSCSYAGGWTSLLTFLGHPKAAPAKTLGVACVPSSHESKAVLTAFNQSVARSVELARQLDFKLTKRKGKACDKQSFSRLLMQVGVCKVLCHGRSLQFTSEVDLMLAHEGTLPSLNRFSTSNTVSRMHEFGWRDGRWLKVSSPIIFTAACSTGLAHIVGVGERVSLLNGLSSAGTRTLVAPRWDAVTISVLPILDDAIKRYLSGMTVAAALRAACYEANEHAPRWLAWTLSIEGDWR